jgi:adenylosuccinate lyase
MAAVRAGVGREQAHEAIRDHAVAVALALREGAPANDLVDRLAADDRLGLDRDAIAAVMADTAGFVGTAPHQAAAFVAEVEAIVADHPAAAHYRPEPVL